MSVRAQFAADETGLTAGRFLAAAAGRLEAAGVEGARHDARLLLAAALGVGPEALLARPERPLSPDEQAHAETLIARRAEREPVARILGTREFWGLEFKVTPAVLDPRPDSETLVRAVLDRIPDPDAPLEILDLGTGSGCLLLALLSKLPGARGLGIDISEAAIEVARENAGILGFSDRAGFQKGSWGADLEGSWQVIVNNPPYIKDTEFEGLAPEVARHDPRLALAGGPDGLDAYRALLPQAARLLAPGGFLALEVGIDQQEAVEALVKSADFAPLGRVRDLGGIERCLVVSFGKD
ncbi:MAG: peptide chain release factor N(5)-glutamine methyltransferase [Kiloniellales bacterium]